MNILVVAATTAEIQPFLDAGIDIDTLITGVGAPASMYTLTNTLHKTKYDMVIQAGIAGTFKTSFELGKTYAVASDVFADLAIIENRQLYTLFDKHFADANQAPYSNGLLENTNVQQFQLKPARAITVNTVADDVTFTNLFKQRFDADIESMEGAAFHYVCLQEQVPFLQIRSISNFVGERTKTNWKTQEAIQHLNQTLFGIIEQLTAEYVQATN
jgi:futalosine hydrolase